MSSLRTSSQERLAHGRSPMRYLNAAWDLKRFVATPGRFWSGKTWTSVSAWCSLRRPSQRRSLLAQGETLHGLRAGSLSFWRRRRSAAELLDLEPERDRQISTSERRKDDCQR